MNRLDIINKICERHGISLAYLFGSCAEQAFQYLKGMEINVEDPLADIDIGVVFQKELAGPAERLHLYAEISTEFGDLFTPYPVDLCFLQENHAVFKLEVIKGYNIYAVSRQYKETFEEMVLRRAADFKPVLDLFFKEALEEVINGH